MVPSEARAFYFCFLRLGVNWAKLVELFLKLLYLLFEKIDKFKLKSSPSFQFFFSRIAGLEPWQSCQLPHHEWWPFWASWAGFLLPLSVWSPAGMHLWLLELVSGFIYVLGKNNYSFLRNTSRLWNVLGRACLGKSETENEPLGSQDRAHRALLTWAAPGHQPSPAEDAPRNTPSLGHTSSWRAKSELDNPLSESK